MEVNLISNITVRNVTRSFVLINNLRIQAAIPQGDKGNNKFDARPWLWCIHPFVSFRHHDASEDLDLALGSCVSPILIRISSSTLALFPLLIISISYYMAWNVLNVFETSTCQSSISRKEYAVSGLNPRKDA